MTMLSALSLRKGISCATFLATFVVLEPILSLTSPIVEILCKHRKGSKVEQSGSARNAMSQEILTQKQKLYFLLQRTG